MSIKSKRPKADPSIARRLFFSVLSLEGIVEPVPEYRFHETRKWRADYCWPKEKVILEIQGGIFVNGRHSRGAALLKEWEKLNAGAALGYRFIYAQPKDLTKPETIAAIRAALQAP